MQLAEPILHCCYTVALKNRDSIIVALQRFSYLRLRMESELGLRLSEQLVQLRIQTDIVNLN